MLYGPYLTQYFYNHIDFLNFTTYYIWNSHCSFINMNILWFLNNFENVLFSVINEKFSISADEWVCKLSQVQRQV
jgi:hypothetical protein